MGLSFENTHQNDIPMDCFAGQLTEEDGVQLLTLFKIESDTRDLMEAIQLYLQKYPYLHTRDEWEKLARDSGFIDDTTNLMLTELEFQVVQFIQTCTSFGLVVTNGAHHIAWSKYYDRNWATNYETWYTDSMTKLLKDPCNRIKAP
jgi:hypothetical protein